MTAVKRDAAGNDKSKIAEEISPAQLESLQAISKEFVAIEIDVGALHYTLVGPARD